MSMRWISGLTLGVLLAGGVVGWQWSRRAAIKPEAVIQPVEASAASTSQGGHPWTDEHWRKTLTAEQYRVCRLKGTERPFTGEYWDTHTSGTYVCVACGEALFRSEHKFDSGTGWPSFDQPTVNDAIVEHADFTLAVPRTEVTCRRCGSHLGHVFTDGPKETTGLRYCINSVSIKLKPK